MLLLALEPKGVRLPASDFPPKAWLFRPRIQILLGLLQQQFKGRHGPQPVDRKARGVQQPGAGHPGGQGHGLDPEDAGPAREARQRQPEDLHNPAVYRLAHPLRGPEIRPPAFRAGDLYKRGAEGLLVRIGVLQDCQPAFRAGLPGQQHPSHQRCRAEA